MVKITFFALASSVVALCVAAQVAKVDATVDKVYVDATGAKIAGVGVCNITAERIECWDMDGAPAESLSERLAAFFTSQNYGGEVNFKFKQKNRWLVIEKTGNERINVNYQRDNNVYASNIGIYTEGKPRLELIRVVTEPQESSAGIIASLDGLPGSPAIDVPFKEGQKVNYDGYEIEIGPAKEWKPSTPAPARSYYGQLNNGKQWRIIIGHERPLNKQGGPILSFEIADKEGKAIRYVDKKGEPVSEVRVLSETTADNTNIRPGGPYEVKYPPALFIMADATTPGASAALTNVNPSKIGALRISGTRQKRVRITGFPLDPKGR